MKTDMIYIGSSAGSVLIGPTLESYTELDDIKQAKKLKSYDGINLIDTLLFVHSDDVSCAQVYKKIYKKYFANYDIIKLSNNEGLIVENNILKKIHS
jgi:dipeptidase E